MWPKKGFGPILLWMLDRIDIGWRHGNPLRFPSRQVETNLSKIDRHSIFGLGMMNILNYRGEEDSNNWPWLVGWLCAKAFWRMNMPHTPGHSPVHYSLDGLVIIPVCRQNGMLWLLSCTSLATCPSSSTWFMPTMIWGNWCLFIIHFFLSWYNFF